MNLELPKIGQIWELDSYSNKIKNSIATMKTQGFYEKVKIKSFLLVINYQTITGNTSNYNSYMCLDQEGKICHIPEWQFKKARRIDTSN